MAEYNLSFGVGGEAHHEHNSRRNPPAHSDPERRTRNFCFEQDPDKLVKKYFGKELAEYNAKQRPSRRIENLYQHYKKLYAEATARDQALGKQYDPKTKQYVQCTKNRDKAKCPEKEIIVQIGDMNNHPDDETSLNVLYDYIEDFMKRNRNLIVTGAYIHFDEAAPHMHMDFIYKAEKETTLRRQYSFDNALKEEGYVSYYDKSQARTVSNFEQWMYKERERLTEISKEYGININQTRAEERRQHLDREEYIAYAKQKEITKINEQHREATEQVQRSVTELQAVKQSLSDLTEQEWNERQAIADLTEQRQDIQRAVTELQERRQELNVKLAQTDFVECPKGKIKHRPFGGDFVEIDWPEYEDFKDKVDELEELIASGQDAQAENEALERSLYNDHKDAGAGLCQDGKQ